MQWAGTGNLTFADRTNANTLAPTRVFVTIIRYFPTKNSNT